MINDICTAKRKELLALPQKPFSEVRKYAWILIVPTNRKHDSGWRLMALIGCTKGDDNKYRPTELIGYCDDINWIFPDNIHYYKYLNRLRTDMTISNCCRVWSDVFSFQVGCCLSSTDIKLILDKDKIK